ncbi:uncharacterized protein DS421_19g652150 [Arachis hypogaea]|uniref:Replication protein A 70 kDa DNA-binding subunit B/D first OB fold domain-containing protein n=1 Tax=Arachis hypogaea TaxID=3818 RepID=A0A6B9V8K5_ARAHY|nr:uncharacterized protein DS421_19g652150 [Arachis hypogaea]
MAKLFDMLMDVSPKKLAWNFLVYVVRLWEAPSRYNPKEINSIEMVGRIQASVPKALVRKWNDNIHEFKMYKMSNFIVVDKRDKTKTTMNRWTLNFSHRTVVVLVENPTFPLQAFRLTQIPKLLNADRIDDSQLVDIMGEVVGKENHRELITSKGKETKRLSILVEDLDNYRIGCVLFGNMVDQILPYLDDGRVEPLIVILQFFRSIRWNEKTSVQSHFDISKLHINSDLEENFDISGLGIPYTPSLFVGNDIITVMECRGRSGSANDAVCTNFLISRLKYMESRKEHLVYRTWQEHVNVKTITMHSDGLYMI